LTFLRDFCIIASERVRKGNNPTTRMRIYYE
jgi:hypothetical protein